MTNWCWAGPVQRRPGFYYNSYAYTQWIANEWLHSIGNKSQWPYTGVILSHQSNLYQACRYLQSRYNGVGWTCCNSLWKAAFNPLPDIRYVILVRVLRNSDQLLIVQLASRSCCILFPLLLIWVYPAYQSRTIENEVELTSSASREHWSWRIQS